MRSQRSLGLAVVLLAALGSGRIAMAGPPLICHPFVTDAAAPMLPWAQGRDWRSPDPAYDVHALVTDTLGLLTADARAAALEWFDAGYLVETYRQLGLIYQHGMLPGKAHWVSLVPADLAELDGYALVQKAAGLAPEAEIDFASYLITSDVPYRDRALAGAVPGSALAQNLSVYDDR